MPFLGPMTTRGIPGAVVDTAANPAPYVSPFVPIQALSLVNTRANAEGALKFIDEAALDPYVFTRESFLQWRNHLASDGKSDATSDMDNIDAELFDDTQTGDAKNNGGALTGTNAPALSTNASNTGSAASSSAPTKNTLQLMPDGSAETLKPLTVEPSKPKAVGITPAK